MNSARNSPAKMASQQTSSEQTMMHILKSNLGTGVLAMPAALSYVGLAVGCFGIPILGFITTHCIYILVQCQQIVLQRRAVKVLTYEQLVEQAMLLGPPWLRKYAITGSNFVATFVQLTQFGVCCVYALFVAENLRTVAINTNIFGDTYSAVDVRVYLLCMYPIMAVLCWTSSLKKLAYVSTIANALQIVGLAIICHNLTIGLPSLWSRPLFTSIDRIPLYLTSVVFAFEGICVVLPVYGAMRKPETFLGPSGVLCTSMALVTILYFTVGFYGYIKFGDQSQGSITLNLPSAPIYELVRVIFMFALLLSCPLQMLVSINFFWPSVERALPEKCSKRTVTLVNLVYRSALVAVTYLLAGVVPLLDLIISLVGALCSSTIALIFPPLIQLVVHYEDRNTCNYWNYMVPKNILVMLIGLFGLISGTYYSSAAIVQRLA
ncbi:Proton-coupled amino acid transporter 4 [Halotydeus destructor]|nr:Proton-coupled amino acid transporter 4 [Halotydeus destructor]